MGKVTSERECAGEGIILIIRADERERAQINTNCVSQSQSLAGWPRETKKLSWRVVKIESLIFFFIFMRASRDINFIPRHGSITHLLAQSPKFKSAQTSLKRNDGNV
jgi:hypothetical protein